MKTATAVRAETTITSILFATDFSESAKTAYLYATEIARRFHSKLHALHVEAPVNYAVPPGLMIPEASLYKEDYDQLKASLRAQLTDTNWEFLVSEGNPWTEILDQADATKADLIVLGCHGRGAVGRLLLGSQAEQVLRRAHCPVLIVGPNVHASVFPSFENVLCASDFGNASRAAIDLACAVADQFRSQLTLLHIIEPREEHLRFVDETAAIAREELVSMLPENAHLKSAAHVVVESGKAPEGILDLAARSAADLIVIGARQPDFSATATTHFGTTTIGKMITQAKCPVLTMRAAAQHFKLS
jgi:nucleotide-binding universal stress UspA family protein